MSKKNKKRRNKPKAKSQQTSNKSETKSQVKSSRQLRTPKNNLQPNQIRTLLIFLKKHWKFGTFLSTISLLTAYYTFQPRTVVFDGTVLNPKDPFSTFFILENKSMCSIKNISTDTIDVSEFESDIFHIGESGIKSINNKLPHPVYREIIPEIKSNDSSTLNPTGIIFDMPTDNIKKAKISIFYSYDYLLCRFNESATFQVLRLSDGSYNWTKF